MTSAVLMKYLVESDNERQAEPPRICLRIHQNILLTLQMNLGYNETAFVKHILLQLGRQNLRNWIRLHRPVRLLIINSVLLTLIYSEY